MSQQRALELVVFQLADGVTEADFVASAAAVSEWAAEQPGFISRELSRSPDGSKWIEVVWWETLEDAERAAQAAESSTACSPMFSKIDFETVTMLHGLPALSKAA